MTALLALAVLSAHPAHWWWPFGAHATAAATPTVLNFTAPATLCDSIGPATFACTDRQQRKAISLQTFRLYYMPQLPHGGNPTLIGPSEWKRLTQWRYVLSWLGEPGSPQSVTMPESCGYGAAIVRAANLAGESCDSNLAPSKTP